MKQATDAKNGETGTGETSFEKIFGFAPDTARPKDKNHPHTAQILVILQNYALLYMKYAAEFALLDDKNDPAWQLRAHYARLKQVILVKYHRGMEAAGKTGYQIEPRAIDS